MRKLTRQITILIPLIIYAAGICAAGSSDASITLDVREKSVDPRLAQKITYEAVHKPLKAIVADLAQISGVTLKAGFNDLDWQVRDRKMNILVKDVTLKDLMVSIARVMKFQWSRNSKVEPPTYRLIQDRKLLGKMEAEQNRKKKAFEEEIIARRQRLVDKLDELGNLSDADGQSLRNKNPYHYLLWKTGAAKATSAIFGEMPELRDTYVKAERNIGIPISRLSPGAQQLLLQAMIGNWPYREFQMGSKRPFPEEIASRLNEAGMSIENVPRPFTQWQRQPGSNFGGLGVGSPLGFFHVCYYTDPDSIGQQRNAEFFLRGAEQGGDGEQIYNQLKSDPRFAEAEKQDAEINKPYLMMDPETEHPDDPDLQLKVKLEVKEEQSDNPGDVRWKKLAAQQKAIANASCLGVVSDSFTRVDGFVNLASGETKLQDVLETFSKGYMYNWEKKESIIEFRYRDWFKKRSAQLPDEWIERWRKILLENGTLKLDEFAQLATLTFEQWEENIFTDSVLSCCSQVEADQWNIIHNQALLCFYLRLKPIQRKILFSPEGLHLASLDPDQWQLAIQMLRHPYNNFWEVSDRLLAKGFDGTMVNGYSTKEKDGRMKYRFTVSNQDEDKVEWNVVMPLYKEPKRESKQAEQKK